MLDQCLAEVKLKRELEREKAEHLEQALKDLEKARDLQMFQEAKLVFSKVLNPMHSHFPKLQDGRRPEVAKGNDGELLRILRRG